MDYLRNRIAVSTEKIKPKGRINYEKLIKCVTEKCVKNLNNPATQKNDSYLITEIGYLKEYQTNVQEYQFHEPCRKKFLNIKIGSTSSISSKAFKCLVTFIQESVIDKGHII